MADRLDGKLTCILAGDWNMNESDWSGLGWLMLEAAIALALLLALVWWTVRGKK
jgi:hypothetical protein